MFSSIARMLVPLLLLCLTLPAFGNGPVVKTAPPPDKNATVVKVTPVVPKTTVTVKSAAPVIVMQAAPVRRIPIYSAMPRTRVYASVSAAPVVSSTSSVTTYVTQAPVVQTTTRTTKVYTSYQTASAPVVYRQTYKASGVNDQFAEIPNRAHDGGTIMVPIQGPAHGPRKIRTGRKGAIYDYGCQKVEFRYMRNGGVKVDYD